MRFRFFLAAIAAFFALAPAHAQSVEAESLAQNYEPRPAIWKLSDRDTTIYLFGTIHVLPEGFRWRNRQFDRIVNEVDSLVLESSDEDAEAAMAQFAPKFRSVNADRQTISEQLPFDLRPKWRQMIESAGRDFALVDAMPLSMAMLGFDATYSDEGLSRRELGVETILTREFRDSGRPIGSIENNGAVMLSLMRMDEGPMLAELTQMLATMPAKPMRASGNERPDWSMEHNWARGRIDPDFDLGMGNGPVGLAFQRVLLARRNERWSHWLQRRLEEPGTILVAVGAGHFEGPFSLHRYLADRGLHAERIN